jgi:ABC-2 type transport system ATP-binding protein
MSAVIDVQHLHKNYGSTVAVDDVSFTVDEGEIFGILGPNGAGKTTTVECIEGLRTPDRGQISVLGLDPRVGPDRRRPGRGVNTPAGLSDPHRHADDAGRLPGERRAAPPN